MATMVNIPVNNDGMTIHYFKITQNPESKPARIAVSKWLIVDVEG